MAKKTWKQTVSTGIAALVLILIGIGLLLFGVLWLYFLFKGIIEEGTRDGSTITSNLGLGLVAAIVGAYMIYLPFEETLKKRIGKKEIPPPPPPPPPSS